VFEHLAYHPEWPKVADTVIEATQADSLIRPRHSFPLAGPFTDGIYI
jgi:hypothetical protein